VDAEEYDLIVIGAGPVGENVADRAVHGGLRTVIVESELVGGECSYWACMPSKTLLRAGAALRGARDAPGAAEAVTGDLDVAAVLRRRDEVVHEWNDAGQVEWLGQAGIDLVRGHGVITGEREVTVGGRVLRARHAVAVCTGSASLLPDVPGIAEAELWTSREATGVRDVPASLVVIGGGVAAAGDRLLKPMKEAIRTSVFEDQWASMAIAVASRLEHAGIIGSALYAKDRLRESGV